MNILIIGQGGYGAHHIKDQLEDEQHQVTVIKKEVATKEIIDRYDCIIISGYKEIMKYAISIFADKEENLPNIYSITHYRICDYQCIIQFLEHPWP